MRKLPSQSFGRNLIHPHFFRDQGDITFVALANNAVKSALRVADPAPEFEEGKNLLVRVKNIENVPDQIAKDLFTERLFAGSCGTSEAQGNGSHTMRVVFRSFAEICGKFGVYNCVHPQFDGNSSQPTSMLVHMPLYATQLVFAPLVGGGDISQVLDQYRNKSLLKPGSIVHAKRANGSVYEEGVLRELVNDPVTGGVLSANIEFSYPTHNSNYGGHPDIGKAGKPGKGQIKKIRAERNKKQLPAAECSSDEEKDLMSEEEQGAAGNSRNSCGCCSCSLS